MKEETKVAMIIGLMFPSKHEVGDVSAVRT